MYRRTLVISLGGLAGCTGAFDAFRGDGGSSRELSDDERGSDDGSTEPESTATADSAGESTADTTVVPPPEQLARMSVDELLSIAREQASLAVDAYAGEGRPLTAVRASSDGFEPPAIIEHLYGSRQAFEAADRQGISSTQDATIQRLRTFETLFRLLIDLQVAFIEVHDALVGLQTATEQVSPQSASSLETRITTRRDDVQSSLSNLSVPQYERAVGVTDRLTQTEYQDKQGQFRAELRVLNDLADVLPLVVEGLRLFSKARARRDAGAPYVAADLAREAESSLARATNGLSTVVANAPPAGQSYVPVLNDLIEVTRTTRVAARDYAEATV